MFCTDLSNVSRNLSHGEDDVLYWKRVSLLLLKCMAKRVVANIAVTWKSLQELNLKQWVSLCIMNIMCVERTTSKFVFSLRDSLTIYLL